MIDWPQKEPRRPANQGGLSPCWPGLSRVAGVSTLFVPAIAVHARGSASALPPMTATMLPPLNPAL
jgi:hypothetical protein